MNHGDTDDTEIVSGDEGDLTPIHDIAIGANDDSEHEPAVESTEAVDTPADVVDELAPVVHEDLATEPQPPAETNLACDLTFSGSDASETVSTGISDSSATGDAAANTAASRRDTNSRARQTRLKN